MLQDEYFDTWQQVSQDFLYLPSKGTYGRAAAATNTDRIESVRAEHESTVHQMKKEAERAHKLQQRLELLTNGLALRAQKLRSEVRSSYTCQCIACMCSGLSAIR